MNTLTLIEPPPRRPRWRRRLLRKALWFSMAGLASVALWVVLYVAVRAFIELSGL